MRSDSLYANITLHLMNYGRKGGTTCYRCKSETSSRIDADNPLLLDCKMIIHKQLC